VARLAGQRFVVRIDGWDRDSASPHGHVARLVGPIGDLRAESESLLVDNGIEVAPFSSGYARLC
jgi:exoribonuclease R